MNRVLAIIALLVFVLFWFVGLPIRVLFAFVQWFDRKLSIFLDKVLNEVL